MTYTQRTLKALRDLGYSAWVCERYHPYAGVRQDLMGIADIIACRKGQPVLAVQSTSGGAHSAHHKMLIGHENTPLWLSTGNGFELWSWRKVLKKHGGKLRIWQPRICAYRLERGYLCWQEFKNLDQYLNPESVLPV